LQFGGKGRRSGKKFQGEESKESSGESSKKVKNNAVGTDTRRGGFREERKQPRGADRKGILGAGEVKSRRRDVIQNGPGGEENICR